MRNGPNADVGNTKSSDSPSASIHVLGPERLRPDFAYVATGPGGATAGTTSSMTFRVARTVCVAVQVMSAPFAGSRLTFDADAVM